MGLYAYCVVPASLPVNTTGIDARPVRAVPAERIALWVTEHDRRPEASPAAIRAHDDVVRAAMTETVTPVPLRFGQWSEDERTLHDRIAERAADWDAMLAAFAGAVELGIRVLGGPGPAAGEAVAAATGTEYLHQLAARQHAADAARAWRASVQSLVAAELGELALQTRSGSEPDRVPGVWLAHLVRRADVSAYGVAVRRIGERLPEARVLFSGPWPPYSFAA